MQAHLAVNHIDDFEPAVRGNRAVPHSSSITPGLDGRRRSSSCDAKIASRKVASNSHQRSQKTRVQRMAREVVPYRAVAEQLTFQPLHREGDVPNSQRTNDQQA
jgi:hypothetical protein